MDCAKSIFGERASGKIQAWVEPLKDMLWDGLAEAVCERLLFEAETPLEVLVRWVNEWAVRVAAHNL